MKKLALTLLFAAGLLTTGCTVGPRYHRPSTQVTPSFREEPPPGWKLAQPSEAINRGKWWEIYSDPQLNQFEELVNVSNQNIQVAVAQFREARDTVRIVRSSLFPTVSVAPEVSNARSSATLSQRSLVNFISGSRNQYSLPFDVSYQADVFGSIRSNVSAARANAQLSAADLENVRLASHAQLAQFYFELRGLDAQADLLQRTVTMYQQYLDLTRARFEVGVASQADVLQAQTQLSTTQAQMVDVGVGRAQFEHAVAVLIGKPPAQVAIAATPLRALPPPIPAGIPSELLERRPDIAAAERQAASANAEIGVARAAFFPALTFSATAGLQSTSVSDWFTWPSRFWTAGPQLAEVLFSGGRRHAQLDFQRAAYDATAASYRQVTLNAFQQVEDNLAALRILEQESAAEEQAVRNAQQTLDIVTEQYKAGVANYLQVITAQATLLQNERTAVDVLTRRMTASVLLIEALGGGWNMSQLPH